MTIKKIFYFYLEKCNERHGINVSDMISFMIKN